MKWPVIETGALSSLPLYRGSICGNVCLLTAGGVLNSLTAAANSAEWVNRPMLLFLFPSCFHLQWGEIWGTAPCIHLQSKLIPRCRQFWEEGKDKEHPDITRQQSVSKAYPSAVSQLPAERGSQPCRQQLHCQGTKLQSQMFLLEVHYTELGKWAQQLPSASLIWS